MFTTHTQPTALQRMSWLFLLLCALLLGGMLYGSHLGAASSPLTTEAPEGSGDPPLITEVKLTASDGEKYDYFGRSVSIDGDYALIGAPYDDEQGRNVGAAYIFRWNGVSWQEEAKLLPSDGDAYDYFGHSVSLSGQVALVGTRKDDEYLYEQPESEVAYLFRRDEEGSQWHEEQKLMVGDGTRDNLFGRGLSLSLRGNMALVGASGNVGSEQVSGAAYLFRWDGNIWQQETKLTITGDFNESGFGSAVSLSDEVLMVSAYYAVYLFRWDGLAWQLEERIADLGEPGILGTYKVSVSGDVALIGTLDRAYLFRFNGKQWQQEAILVEFDEQQPNLEPRAVAVKGELAVVGSPYKNDNNAAYLFRWDGSSWQQEAILQGFDVEPYDYFGNAVSLSDSRLLVGAFGDNEMTGVDIGAAYLYNISTSDVPDIALAPSSISSVASYGQPFSNTLVIANQGTVPLSWALNDNEDNESWVEIEPSEGLLTASAAQSLTLEFNSQLPVGDYRESLMISSNDPDEANVEVKVRHQVRRVTTELELPSSTPHAGDYFGHAVSISGDVAAIGAYLDDQEGEDSGSVTIFRKSLDGSGGRGWQEEAMLAPGEAGDSFGASVSISGDRLLIGASGDDDKQENAGAAYIYRWNGKAWQQEDKLLASDGTHDKYFGSTVALSGNVAAVSAPYRSNNGTKSDSVYIFRRNGSDWQEEAILFTTDETSLRGFGEALSLSCDGEHNCLLLVGAPALYDYESLRSAAYLFRWDGSSWVQEAKLTASDEDKADQFGAAVSIDDSVALIGAPNGSDYGSRSGAAYLFRRNGSQWLEETKLTPSDEGWGNSFGSAVSLSGELALIGNQHDYRREVISAYLFRWNGSAWIEEAILSSRDGQPSKLSLSLSDNLALLGVPYKSDNLLGNSIGTAYLHNISPGDVPDIALSASYLRETIVEGTRITQPLTIENSGTQTLTWAIQPAAVDWLTTTPSSATLPAQNAQTITIDFDASTLIPGKQTSKLTISSDDPDEPLTEVPIVLKILPSETKLLASDGSSRDDFGSAIAMSGELALIGAREDVNDGKRSGSAYIYRFDGENWQQESKLLGSQESDQESFGSSVSLYDQRALIGEPSTFGPGAAYLFGWNGKAWREQAKLTASDGQNENYFGSSVWLSGDVALIGARADDGDDGDDALYENSGAVYIFRNNGTDWQQESKLIADDGAAYDYFGSAVSLHHDAKGDEIALVGAPYHDEQGENSGAAYIFRWDGQTWQQEAKLLASDGKADDDFGWAVSVSGELALVGAPRYSQNGGAAYLYRWNGEQWLEEATFRSTDDGFGSAVSISEKFILIGASLDDNENGQDAGAAYLYRWNGNRWQQEIKLIASEGSPQDRFGQKAMLNDDLAMISAAYDDDNGSSSGSVYLYDLASLPELTISTEHIRAILFTERTTNETVTIGNSGNEPLTWQISWQAAWLAPTMLAGTISPQQSQALTININSSTLKTGHYTDTLLLTIGSQTTIELSVELSVIEPQSYLPLISR